jgi:copper(I)-binding protein
VEEQGVARMRPVASVDIAPGATVVAAPGGLHLMLVGLDGPLVAGESVPVTLQFRDAGAVAIELRVQPLDATAPTRTHH